VCADCGIGGLGGLVYWMEVVGVIACRVWLVRRSLYCGIRIRCGMEVGMVYELGGVGGGGVEHVVGGVVGVGGLVGRGELGGGGRLVFGFVRWGEFVVCVLFRGRVSGWVHWMYFVVGCLRCC